MQFPPYISDKFKKEINTFCHNLPGVPAELYAPMKHLLLARSKHIRPLLLLMTCEIMGGDIDEAMPAAIGIELFHTFTLMHDDISDKAPMRRGVPSVHTKWNSDIAMLSGDAMLIMANQHLLQTPSHARQEVLKLFNDAGIKVCEGQQMDMNFESAKEVSMEQYMQMIKLKTAALFSASLAIGAAIAKAPEDRIEKVKEVGETIGMIFQMQDDYLDLFGSSVEEGKQYGGDVLNNKKTYLVVKGLEKADKAQKKALLAAINSKDDGNMKIERVKNILVELEVDKEVTLEIFNYLIRGADTIHFVFPRGYYNTVGESPKAKLLEMYQEVTNRPYKKNL